MMRKLILMAAMAATIVPSAAIAQRYDGHRDRSEVRHDQREVRDDRQDLRRDQRDLRQDRRDNRHDRRHHSAYVAPYHNWNYRPVTIGFRLQPAFYGSRYYINDYGTYNLRAPGRWQRWIRYGDDLLLVNTRTGRVLQVLHNRYW
jgi:Ni/Co efflux regulator RcnB